jgi:hypothetical protein
MSAYDPKSAKGAKPNLQNICRVFGVSPAQDCDWQDAPITSGRGEEGIHSGENE